MSVYHITTEKNLFKIREQRFCARLYIPESFNLMHENLHRMHNKLAGGRSLFRFCFYNDLSKAQRSAKSDFASNKNYILRLKKSQFSEEGFRWQWDEGFNEGEAHLFWVEENLNDTGYSKAGISFSNIDILIDGKWVLLECFYSELVDINNEGEVPGIQTVDKNSSEVWLSKLFRRGFAKR